MDQVEKNKVIKSSAIPYGKLLNEIASNRDLKLAPVVEYALNIYNEKSPLVLMANFADSLKSRFSNELSERSYKQLGAIATQLNIEIIGTPSTKLTSKTDRPFIGCQVSSTRGNKIYLSTDLSVFLARATIAHEIMHTLFDTVNNKRPGNLSSDPIEEVLCDYGAARFLSDDAEFENELSNNLRPNFAEKIVYLSRHFNIPRNYIAYRIFDPLSKNNTNRISAIVEWQLRQNEDVDNIKLVPFWSTSQNSYIPSRKDKTVTAKESSIIYQTFFSKSENEFIVSNAKESVSIGGLRGNYEVFVCAFGKVESNTRFAMSVFVPC